MLSRLPVILPRVRDWRVRSKIAAVLVLPAVAFALVAGAQAAAAVAQASNGDAFARRVAVANAATDLINRLQFERDLSDTVNPPASRDEAVRATDTAARRWDGAVRAYGRALPAGLASLPERLPMLRGQAQLSVVYRDLIEQLIAVIDSTATGIDDTLTVSLVTAMAELARAKEATAQLRAFGRVVPPVGGVEVSQRIALLRQARDDATRRYLQAAARVAGTPPVGAPDPAELNGVADQLATGVVDPARWWNAASAELDDWRAVEAALGERLAQQADERIAAARTRAVTVIALMLLVLLITITLSILIGRSMVTSLRDLRSRALAVAHHELPQTLTTLRSAGPRDRLPDPPPPPPSTGADEIGDVAAAFAAVHHSAVEVALRQARSRHTLNSIFVNLARRSQVLVERQLRQLDEMEREERDPDRLAALFRLDHLAARLRRNDENLLVLAGAEPRRRWREGVPLAALALAALAEIEQYERVRADVDDHLHVAGHAAADLVHLLAELLDNATVFSAPDTPVRVSTQSSADAAVVEITDEGIGLSADSLDELNALLATPPEVDAATSERMGLVVVSHLAARHGVRVSLASTGAGVSATVRLPAQLLAEPAAPEQPVTAPRPLRSTTPTSTSTMETAGLPRRVPRARRGEPVPATAAAALTGLHDEVRPGPASAAEESIDIKGEP